MLKEGNKAPAFNLENSKEDKVKLSDYEGQKVVVYFYPKDDTPGCTIEANDFTKLLPKFKKKNTEVIGISKDSCESHAKFEEKYKLKVNLLSDPDSKVIQAYGAWGEKNNYGKKYMGLIRTTVLVDEKGKVEKVWSNVKAKGHAEKVLESIE